MWNENFRSFHEGAECQSKVEFEWHFPFCLMSTSNAVVCILKSCPFILWKRMEIKKWSADIDKKDSPMKIIHVALALDASNMRHKVVDRGLHWEEKSKSTGDMLVLQHPQSWTQKLRPNWVYFKYMLSLMEWEPVIWVYSCHMSLFNFCTLKTSFKNSLCRH